MDAWEVYERRSEPFPRLNKAGGFCCVRVSREPPTHPAIWQLGDSGGQSGIAKYYYVLLGSCQGRDSEVNLSGTVRKILWSGKLLMKEYSWVKKNQWYINIGRQLRQGETDWYTDRIPGR